MARYAKLVTALIGALIELINVLFGINLGVDAQQILHVLIPILTAAGVWGVPNAPQAA